MPQFDWLCDVCGCVMSPTSGIYWVELGLINNYKELQLWLVLLRYNADVASASPWIVMPQFDWLCEVCGCVMSPTSGIYWIKLSFINNYKKLQLWLVLLRYSADVTNVFPWVVTHPMCFPKRCGTLGLLLPLVLHNPPPLQAQTSSRVGPTLPIGT